MALDNYANLKASIETWSHREDVKGVIDDFIVIAETEMYSNPDSRLRLRSMEQVSVVQTSITEGFVLLPSGFLEARRIDILVDDIAITLQYKAPEQMHVDTTRTGVPHYFTIIGDQVLFELLPDDVYDITIFYYGKLTPLSDANPVNDILTNYPNIYLYGALRSLFQWARNPEEENANYSRFIKAIEGARLTSRKSSYGPAPAMRLRSATP